MTRVSSSKLIRTLAALSFSSTNLAMNPNILLISSKMWRPQNHFLLSTNSSSILLASFPTIHLARAP